jgi:Sec-independent protein translocase protein TatA
MPEVVVILVIAPFILGGSRLPHLGEERGKPVRGFKKNLSDFPDEVAKNDKENKRHKDGPSA